MIWIYKKSNEIVSPLFLESTKRILSSLPEL